MGQVTSAWQFVADVILLHHTVYLVDVLMMYAFLIAIAAGGLWLLVHGRTWYLLVGSFALWLAYQFEPAWADGIPWPIQHNTMFHIAPWQFTFVVALCIGYHHLAFTNWLNRIAVLAFGGAALIFGVLVYLELTHAQQPLLAQLSAKPSEGPVRILACLFVFQLVRYLVTYFWRPLYAGLGWLLLPLGQNSLYAYTMHIVIIAAVWRLAVPHQGSEAFNLALQLSTILVVWALVKKKILFNVIPR